MYSYPGSNAQQKYVYSSKINVKPQSPKSPVFSPSLSKSQSRYNDVYRERKRGLALFKHQISPDSEKYLPPHLRSPSATTQKSFRDDYPEENKHDHFEDEPKIKPYSIALKTPNQMIYANKEPKVAILSASKILRNIDQDIRRNDKFGVLSPQRPDTARSMTYQEKNIKGIATSWNLQTSSEREIALKRILGAQMVGKNPLHQSAIGTLRVYQTDDFSYEQRTSCIILTGLCLATLFVIFVIVFGQWIWLNPLRLFPFIVPI